MSLNPFKTGLVMYLDISHLKLPFKDELRDGASILRYFSTVGDLTDEDITNADDQDVEIFKEKEKTNLKTSPLKTSQNWRIEA